MSSNLIPPSIGVSSLSADVESAGGSTVLPTARASLSRNDPQPWRPIGLPDPFGVVGVLLLRGCLALAVAFLPSAKVFAKVKVRAAYVHLKSSPAFVTQHKGLL